ncbi:MAG TPA: 1-acyl-sn-glycerol-3-phosphate acyltransferase [Thermoanaerobaculia bacterium]|nr:1-acyl-sn-glycerol-3-phosphate acyltransferase [Thermoanaerobaculia bacterium]
MESKVESLSVESGAPGYAVVRALARLLLALFYRRIDVVGIENVPAEGGLVVAANHHNSVVDAMLLIARLPRRGRALANAPLFGHVLMGPFLRLVGALPVHRRQEAGTDPARNAALFAATTATLRGGGAIVIFPEGRTQAEPVLLELRTGAARMLLAAELATEELAAQPVVTLLPVGLVFNAPGTFREGTALVLIGPPIPTADAVALARSEPERAARVLTEDLAAALRGVIVEADDRQTLSHLRFAEELWRQEGGEVAADPAGRAAWLRSAMRSYRLLLERAPARVATFRQRLAELAEDLERAGFGLAVLARPATPARLAGRVALQATLLLLLAPLAVVGIALHVLPYKLTGLGVKALKATDEEEATDKILIGLLLFPLFWALEAWAALRWGGQWGAITFLALLFPAGFLALGWHERLNRLRRDIRAFASSRRDRDLPARLLERRKALAAELRELAGLVPEEWPGLGT